jgi:hypothetical protein
MFMSIKSQDIESFDPTPTYNWLDPSYEDFFSQPIIYTKKSTNTDITIIPTTNYNQGTPNSWYDDSYGEIDACKKLKDGVLVDKTIGEKGCAITCQAMILNSRGFSFDPGTWNTYLRNNNGYTGCGVNLQNNPMYTYSKRYGTFISKQYPVDYRGTVEDGYAAIMMKYFIDRGAYIMLKVTIIGRSDGTFDSTSGHFILVIGYNTDTPTLNDFIVLDPGTSYGDNQNMTLENYDLFISKTGYPTIRIYTKVSYSPVQPPEIPTNIPWDYETGEYLNIALPTQKSSTIFYYSWILKRNGNTIDTQIGSNYNYFLSKPGDYTLTLVVGGDHGITESTKAFVVTGEPIVYPEDCRGALHTIPSELSVTQNSISFIYKICSDFVDGIFQPVACDRDGCNWNCFQHAIKATGPNNFENYQHNSKSSYSYSNLEPNSTYKFWASGMGWECGIFWNCSYNDDKFFSECYANIITTPNMLSINTKLMKNGNLEDKAFSKIVLSPGFSYKPQSAGDSYSAKIASGKQFWITCVDCDSKKSATIQSEKQTKDCDCNNEEMSTDSTFNNILQTDVVQIYPNPTNGIVNIQTNPDNNYIVDVYNLQGTILLTSSGNQIDLSDFPSGFYFIRVRSSAFVQIKRIFIVN